MLLLAQITTVSKPHDADMIRITTDEILPQTWQRPTENLVRFFWMTCLTSFYPKRQQVWPLSYKTTWEHVVLSNRRKRVNSLGLISCADRFSTLR